MPSRGCFLLQPLVLVLLWPASSFGQFSWVLRDGAGPDGGYAGTRDTTIADAIIHRSPSETVWQPDANYDRGYNMVDGDPDKVALLRWDVSALPPATAVSGATVTLRMTNQISIGTYTLWEGLRPWVASQATWLKASDISLWAVPGARGIGSDRGSAPLGSLGAGGPQVVVSLNAAGVAVVQRWIDNPSTNFGLLIEDPGNSNGGDFSNGDDPTPAFRPRLTVQHGTSQSMGFQNRVVPTAGYAGMTDTTIADGSATATHAVDRLRLSSSEGVLLSFDLSDVPPGTEVLDAGLLFTAVGGSDAGFGVYQVLRPWTETGANWIQYDGVNEWSRPGATGAGDHAPQPLTTTPPVAGQGGFSVPLGPAGVALLQQWIDRAVPNNGFYIGNYATSDRLNLRERESSAALRPALELLFVVRSPPDGGADGGEGGDGGPCPGCRSPPLHLAVGCGCSSLAGLVPLWTLGAWLFRRRRRRA